MTYPITIVNPISLPISLLLNNIAHTNPEENNRIHISLSAKLESIIIPKNFYADKTNWREMLKISSSNVDLQLERDNALEKIPKEALVSVQTKKYSTFNIDYPVNK